MRLVQLRLRAARLGVVVLPDGAGWLVTNEGTAKGLRESACQSLDAVEWVVEDLEGKRNETRSVQV